jgi:hypothetical protein
LRAITAARLYGTGQISSLVKAAECCGSNRHYVKAATILLKTENEALLGRVLAGHELMLRAAQQTRRVADLIAAYRSATDADRVAFARTCGTEEILNVLAAASISTTEISASKLGKKSLQAGRLPQSKLGWPWRNPSAFQEILKFPNRESRRDRPASQGTAQTRRQAHERE